jgi:hypothetical protein
VKEMGLEKEEGLKEIFSWVCDLEIKVKVNMTILGWQNNQPPVIL